MANFKKMDEKDFVFINRPISKQEEDSFSVFLKERKQKTMSKKIKKAKKEELA